VELSDEGGDARDFEAFVTSGIADGPIVTDVAERGVSAKAFEPQVVTTGYTGSAEG
jgi:hypothetical protein